MRLVAGHDGVARQGPGEVEVRARLDYDDAVRGRERGREQLGGVVAGEGGADDEDGGAGIRGSGGGEGTARVAEAVELGADGAVGGVGDGVEGVADYFEDEAELGEGEHVGSGVGGHGAGGVRRWGWGCIIWYLIRRSFILVRDRQQFGAGSSSGMEPKDTCPEFGGRVIRRTPQPSVEHYQKIHFLSFIDMSGWAL